MAGLGFPRRFSLELFAEGTLEGRMETAQDISEMLPRLKRNTLLGLTSSILVSVVLAGMLFQASCGFIRGLIFSTTFPSLSLWALLFLASCSFLLALSLFSTLLMFQAGNFQVVLASRMNNIDDLFSSPPENPLSQDENQGLPGINPVESIDNMTGDIFSQSQPLESQTETVIAVLLGSAAFFFSTTMVTLKGSDWIMTDFGWGPAMAVLFCALASVCTASTLFLLENKRFFQFLRARNSLLWDIMSSPNPQVPQGNGPLEKFDDFLKEYRGMTRSKRSINLHGHSGDIHNIDLYATDNSTIAFVRTKEMPTRKDVEDMATAIRDVLESKSTPEPGGVVAVLLYNDPGEEMRIDDDTAAAVRENLIPLSKGPGGGNKLAAVHIVLDHGDVYSFFPLLPLCSYSTSVGGSG